MKFDAPIKGGKSRNNIMHNVVWANQKTGCLVYHWLRALAMCNVIPSVVDTLITIITRADWLHAVGLIWCLRHARISSLPVGLGRQTTSKVHHNNCVIMYSKQIMAPYNVTNPQLIPGLSLHPRAVCCFRCLNKPVIL